MSDSVRLSAVKDLFAAIPPIPNPCFSHPRFRSVSPVGNHAAAKLDYYVPANGSYVPTCHPVSGSFSGLRVHNMPGSFHAYSSSYSSSYSGSYASFPESGSFSGSYGSYGSFAGSGSFSGSYGSFAGSGSLSGSYGSFAGSGSLSGSYGSFAGSGSLSGSYGSFAGSGSLSGSYGSYGSYGSFSTSFGSFHPPVCETAVSTDAEESTNTERETIIAAPPADESYIEPEFHTDKPYMGSWTWDSTVCGYGLDLI